jgi:hypothetical protein
VCVCPTRLVMISYYFIPMQPVRDLKNMLGWTFGGTNAMQLKRHRVRDV